jgi:hypothetical protein
MVEMTQREMASLGGKRRATNLTAERRREIAVNAALARWAGHVRKGKSHSKLVPSK